MASHIQLMVYEGYLGADPEMRYTPGGRAVTNFRVASTRAYYRATEGGDKELVKETTWLKCTAWGNRAENVNNMCKKGTHVIVTGHLRTGENGSPTVFTLSSGEPAASYEVTAEDVRILDGYKDRDEDSSVDDEPENDSNIPF